MKRVLIGVLVLTLALGLVGCKSIEDKIGEEVGEQIVGAATGSDVEVEGDNVTIETDEGAVTVGGSDTELPDGFPEDFPLYDDYELDGASSMTGGGSATYYVNMYTNDSPDEVYEWYKTELADKGWNISGDSKYSDSSGTSAMITADKGDMEATITITTEAPRAFFGVILVVGGQ